jgi:hypothetical protein
LGAWTLLFGSLTMSAGHGVFLFFVVTKNSWIPSMRDLGGSTIAPLVGWFVACVPLALLAWLLRRTLMRWSLLPALAGASALASLVAFALYLKVMSGA